MKHYRQAIVIGAIIIAGLWLLSVNESPPNQNRLAEQHEETMSESEIPNDLNAEGLVPLPKTDAEWKARLTAEQYHVTRQQGTERAYTGAYWETKTPGLYRCRCCWQPLFRSTAKYKSGTGWPSFWEPVAEDAVATRVDRKLLFSVRTEVICRRCEAHLGHVFEDGPEPTGLRYCMNSASLYLQPEADE